MTTVQPTDSLLLNRAAWLTDAGYGLALCWTTSSLSRGGSTPLSFPEAVGRFDVARLVQQCVDSGGGWLKRAFDRGSRATACPDN